MTSKAAPAGKRKRVRSTPKGRRVEPQARQDVLDLLGSEPAGARSADRAPAQDPGPLRPSVRGPPSGPGGRDEDGDDRGLRGGHVLPPLRRDQGGRYRAAAITVRSAIRSPAISAGDHDLLKALPACSARTCASCMRPCVGRCETAPVAASARTLSRSQHRQKVSALGAGSRPSPTHVRHRHHARARGLRGVSRRRRLREARPAWRSTHPADAMT